MDSADLLLILLKSSLTMNTLHSHIFERKEEQGKEKGKKKEEGRREGGRKNKRKKKGREKQRNKGRKKSNDCLMLTELCDSFQISTLS